MKKKKKKKSSKDISKRKPKKSRKIVKKRRRVVMSVSKRKKKGKRDPDVFSSDPGFVVPFVPASAPLNGASAGKPAAVLVLEKELAEAVRVMEQEISVSVIPAKAGIQSMWNKSGFPIKLGMTGLASKAKQYCKEVSQDFSKKSVRLFNRCKKNTTAQSQKEVTLFANTKYPLSFKPFHIFQGVAVLALFVGLAGVLIPQPKINPAQIIETAKIHQTSPIVVKGDSVKWSVLIKKSDITAEKKFVALPKNAQKIKVETISQRDVDIILAEETLNKYPADYLTLQDRKHLAGRFTVDLAGINFRTTNTAGLLEVKEFVLRVFQAINTYLFADLEQAVSNVIDQLVEKSNKDIKETEDAKIVDISKEEIKEDKDEAKQEKKSEIEAPVETITAEPEAIVEPPAEPAVTADPVSVETPAEEPPAGSNDILPEAEAEEYVAVTYETPAPTITEQETSTGKIVTVSAPTESASETSTGSNDIFSGGTSDVRPTSQYTNVLAHTNIPEIYKVGQEDKIKLNWKTNGDQPMEFHAYDLNNNGKLDYVEWTVPHLSDQIFEIIFISKAWLLDSSKEITEDIYDQVATQDGTYATVPANDYVRVTFQATLENNNDITVYARPNVQVLGYQKIDNKKSAKNAEVLRNATRRDVPELSSNLSIADNSPVSRGTSENNFELLDRGGKGDRAPGFMNDNSETAPSYPHGKYIIPQNLAGGLIPTANAAEYPTIEVYPVYTDANGVQTEGPLVTTFDPITSEGTYKVLLTTLAQPTDKFDLRVRGGSLDIDYIVDPVGWLTGWAHRKKITIDNAQVDADLTNFPTLVKIAGDADMATALSTGYDVRFTDAGGTNLLAYETESWTGGAGASVTANIWVKVPTVATAADTDIYVYYGNLSITTNWSTTTSTLTNCTAITNAQCVWKEGSSQNYAGVWHLNDPTSPTDSTSNANNGTNNGVTATTGKVGGAGSFVQSSNQDINVGSNASLDITGDISVFAWIKSPSSGSYKDILTKYNGSTTFYLYLVDDDLRWFDGSERSSGYAVSSDAWTMVGATREDGLITLFANGISVGPQFTSLTVSSINASAFIGGLSNNTQYFDGLIDESRISSTARSADWIKFEYANQSSADAELTFATEENNLTWLAGWSYRKKITIDHTKVGATTEDQTNFPVLVTLTGLSNINTNGTDIRFTTQDGGTYLPREIESYSAGTLVAWVKVPTLSHDYDTSIYMYYGNSSATEPAADSTYGKNAVWDSNFAGVWHLKETGAGATADYKDSTANANSSTNTTGQPTVNTSGKIGNAESFTSASSQYITVPTISIPTNISVGAWVYSTNYGANMFVVQKETVNSSWELFFEAGLLKWRGGGQAAVTCSPPTNSQWHYIAGTQSGTTATVYIDGTQCNTGLVDAIGNGSGAVDIGAYVDSSGGYYFNGLLDETRVSDTARSAGWISTEYANQNSPSTFYTVATTESSNLDWLSGWSNRKKITIKHTQVDEDLTNFPLLVKLTANADLSGALSTGYDVRFTQSDGTTILPYERESWTGGAGTAVTANLWVKVPTITTAADTDLWLYYGNSSATDGQDATNVWDSNFKGVYHLNQSSGTILDSTENANNLTAYGSPTYGATCQTGLGLTLVAASRQYLLNNSALVSAAPLTMSLWYKPTTQSFARIMEINNSGNYSNNFRLAHRGDVSNYIEALTQGSSYAYARSTLGATDNAWNYGVAVFSATNSRKVYINGGNSATDTADFIPVDLNETIVGSGENPASSGECFDGSIDEVRISSVARSASWIKFEYANQSSADSELIMEGSSTGNGITWTNGSGDNKWSTAANWQGGVAPTLADTAVFTSSATDNCTIDTNVSVAGINITNGYTGTITQSSTYTVTVGAEGFTQAGGTFAISSGATFNLDANNLTLSAGTFTNSGTLQLTGDNTITGTPTLASGSTVEYTATSGSRAISNWAYYNLIINGAGGTFNLPANTTVNGNLAITNGILDATTSNYNLTVNGSWTQAGGTFTPRSATVTMAGGGTITATSAFNNLTINGSDSVVSSNLKGWWKFDDASGTSATDSSGNNNDCTLDAGETWATGVLDGALRFNGADHYSFDGTNHYLDAGVIGELNNDVTVAFWMKTNQTGDAGIIDVGDGNTYQKGLFITLKNSGTGIRFARNPGGWLVDSNDVIVNDNAWHHFVCTYNSSGTGMGYVFVDGVQRGSKSGILTAGSTADISFRMAVRRDSPYPGNFLDGPLDDVRVYNTALTVAQARALASGNEPGYTLASNITVNGTLTHTAGTLAQTSYNISTAGFTITAGLLTRTSGTFNSGIVTADGTTLTFAKNGSTPATFSGAVTVTYPGILLNGGIFNGAASFTKTGSLQDLGSGGNTFNSTASFTNNGSNNLFLAHTTANTYANDVTFTNTSTGGGGIMVYTGSTGNAFNGNIIVNNTSGGVLFGMSGSDYSGTGTLILGKTISIGVGGFSAGRLGIRNLTYNDTTALSLTFTGTAGFLTSGTTIFACNLTVIAPLISLNGGTFNGTVSFTQNVGLANSNGGNTFNSTASFINSGTGQMILGGMVTGDTYNGDVTFTNSGASVIKVGYTGTTNIFNGNVTVSGSVTLGYIDSTMQFTKATGTQTLDSGGVTIPKLVHSGAGTLQLTGNNLTVNSILTNSAGTIDLNGKNLIATSATFSNDNGTIALNGGEAITGLTQDATHGTFLYTGTAGPYTLKNYTYNNLTINGSGATFNLPAALTVNGTLTQTAGTIGTGAYALNVAGTWAGNGQTVTGSGDGAVVLNGASQSISGSTTFYNLTKSVTTADTLTFTAGTTQTVSNTLTLAGASGQLLSLRSSSTPTQWLINPQGTRTVSYLDIKDSNNTNATIFATAGLNCTDSGNNTNWLFDITAPTTTATATSNGASYTFDNWTANTVTVTLTCADNEGGTGCATTKYCTEPVINTGQAPSCTPTTTYSTPVTISTEGTSYIRYYSTDTVPNTETAKSSTIKVDTTAPVTAVSTTNTDNNITATLTCADGAGSGCGATYYCADASNACVPTTLYAAPASFSANNVAFFRYYSTDFVSNASTTQSETITPILPGASPALQGASENLNVQVPISNQTQNPQTTNTNPNLLNQLSQQVQNIANQIAQNIANVFTPSSGQTNLPSIVESVPVNAPVALQGWDIMEVKPLSELALTPVESDIGFFADKIPQFKQTLSAFGIDVNNVNDVQKVIGTELYLPGLTQTVLTQAEILAINKFAEAPTPAPEVGGKAEEGKGLVAPGTLAMNGFASVQGVPLASLSPEARQKIPSDIVFARTGGELIDYSMAISVNSEGKVQQKIATVSAKPMELVIKPDQPASSVTGYITLTKAQVGQKDKPSVLGYMTKFLTASVASSVNEKKATQNGSTENALLVNKFTYAETQPGIFIANISAPATEGEYEISTVIVPKDISIAPKETKMAVVVNPEGYVYSQTPDGRLRIQGASVSLYYLNTATKEYEVWPADKFLQKNPVKTDETGKFSFLVPKGTYKIKVETGNYKIFESAPFEMKQDIAVNMNIELFKKTGLLSWLNLQNIIIALLIAVIILLFTIAIIFIKRSPARR